MADAETPGFYFWHLTYSGAVVAEGAVRDALAASLVVPPDPAGDYIIYLVPGTHSALDTVTDYWAIQWLANGTQWVNGGTSGTTPGNLAPGAYTIIDQPMNGAVEWKPTALPTGFRYDSDPSTQENPMATTDPNAPANPPDTTLGGGGDFTPGSDDPNYRAPGSNQVDEDTTQTGDATRDTSTTALPNGTVGRTGDTDSHNHDPATLGDTTVPGYGNAYRTGDVDPHTKDPVDYSTRDTTVLGGGVAASSPGQVYRAPSQEAPASTFETSGRAGTLAVNPGSPDAAVVGNASGVNPNAVEPGFTNAANTATSLDTTNAGAPSISPVPAASGTPVAPGRPTVAAIAGRAACHVTWTAPANAVATKVVAYVVVSNTGGETEVGKNNLTVEFEQGLVPGDTYTFQVFARTANGTGPRSTASLPFTVPKTDNILPDTERDEGL